MSLAVPGTQGLGPARPRSTLGLMELHCEPLTLTTGMKLLINCYNGPLPYVFTSYSRADRDEVSTDLQTLYDFGCRIWYDSGIAPGSNWADEIAQAISGCSLFIIFLSPQAASSGFVQKEVEYALSCQKRLVPIHLKETVISRGLKLHLDPIQAILKHALSNEDYTAALRQVALSSVAKSEQQLIEELSIRISEAVRQRLTNIESAFRLGLVELTHSREEKGISATLNSSLAPGEASDLQNRGWHVQSLDGPAVRQFSDDFDGMILSIISTNALLQAYSVTDRWGTAQAMMRETFDQCKA